MDEPLGRDSLGRLIYEGDYLTYWDLFDHLLAAYKNDNGTIECFWTAPGSPYIGHDWFFPESMTLRLDISPNLTNYQRYFADLASYDDLISIIYDQDMDTDDGYYFWTHFLDPLKVYTPSVPQGYKPELRSWLEEGAMA